MQKVIIAPIVRNVRDGVRIVRTDGRHVVEQWLPGPIWDWHLFTYDDPDAAWRRAWRLRWYMLILLSPVALPDDYKEIKPALRRITAEARKRHRGSDFQKQQRWLHSLGAEDNDLSSMLDGKITNSGRKPYWPAVLRSRPLSKQ